MLVFSRKKNESIVIDDAITVVVVEIQGDTVRLGISRPRDVPVYRRELPPSEDVESFRNYGGKTTRMLVISRKKNEGVCIGNDVVIAIVDIRGDKVRLGIEYPREVAVHRKEVYEVIKRSKANRPVQNESDAREISVFIDPGEASEELLTEFYAALSAYYRALDGSGLAIIKDDRRSLVGEMP